MKTKRNILIFLAVILFICTWLFGYMVGYSVAKQEGERIVNTK